MRWYKNKSLLFYNYINGNFIGNYLENKIDIYSPSMTKKLDKKIIRKIKKMKILINLKKFILLILIMIKKTILYMPVFLMVKWLKLFMNANMSNSVIKKF